MRSQSKTIVINDSIVSYSDVGKGGIIILVHGWLDSKETFNQLIEQLQVKYRCIALDLPNFGTSDQSQRCTTIQEYAAFLQAFIAKMNIKQYSLLGHSMGGQIILYATAQNIVQPEALLLVASAGVREGLASKKMLAVFVQPLKAIVPKKLKAKLYKLAGSDYSSDLSAVHKMIIGNVLQFDIQRDATLVMTKTLLIYGQDDRHTPPQMGEKLHQQIAGSTFVVFPDANHWIHQKNAKDVVHTIEEFLQ